MSATGLPPPIVMTRPDHKRLSGLTPSAVWRMSAAGRFLQSELARARIVGAEEIAPTVVTMNSDAEFREHQFGWTMRVILVYPGQEDIARRKVSVLTPVGAALIGLSESQSIAWEARTGEWRSLTLLKVHAQPEAKQHDRAPQHA